MIKQSDNRYKVAILANENKDDHLKWIDACVKRSDVIDYSIINLTNDDWLQNITSDNYDIFLLRPPGRTELYKRLYDERVLIISTILKKAIYPSLDEVLIYENKRYLRDWLVAKNLPHPETYIFMNEEEALRFVQKRTDWPIVAKSNIGASGNGVKFLSKRDDAKLYVRKIFSKGVHSRTGPKILKGSILGKVWKGISNPGFFKKRINEYQSVFFNPQKGFVIFQEFISHEYEWRCVRIDGSFFAHKKIATNNKASGRLIKVYDPVPVKLLDFLYEVTERTKLFSASIDLFETDRGFLINEIQCFFGQSDPFQMLVDGKPGRYKRDDNNWIFEEGLFNTNMSYDLRMGHVIQILEATH